MKTFKIAGDHITSYNTLEGPWGEWTNLPSCDSLPLSSGSFIRRRECKIKINGEDKCRSAQAIEKIQCSENDSSPDKKQSGFIKLGESEKRLMIERFQIEPNCSFVHFTTDSSNLEYIRGC